MKRLFIFCIVTFIAVTSSAQWMGTLNTTQIVTFGVHDSSFFVSFPGGPLDKLNPSTLNGGPSDAGINFSQGDVTSFASLGQYFFVGTTESSGGHGPIYRSADNGADWNKISAGGPVATNGKYLYGTYVSFYGTHPTYLARSRDSNTWDSVANINVSLFGTMGSHILATSSSGLWLSTDSGTTWSQLSYPLASPNTFAVVDTAIFGGSNTNDAIATQGIARSLDSGATWQKLNFPHSTQALATDGKNLFAGTIDSGVFLSTDLGNSWRQVNEGLSPNLTVSALIVFDTLLIVNSSNAFNNFTGSRSIPEMVDTNPASVVQISSADSLSIFPNPAMGAVTILAGGTSILGVTVLNVLGENVLDMPNLRESNITLDLSKLPSGTYFLQIQTANGSVLRKVVKEE